MSQETIFLWAIASLARGYVRRRGATDENNREKIDSHPAKIATFAQTKVSSSMGRTTHPSLHLQNLSLPLSPRLQNQTHTELLCGYAPTQRQKKTPTKQKTRRL